MNQIESILSRMKEDMKLRGFADSTQKNYLLYARIFLERAGRPSEELGEADIREHLMYLQTEKKLARGSVNMVNAVLRFLFEVTLEQNLNHRRVPRLRETRGLPKTLTKEEIRRIFAQVDNLKYKAILMTAYGGGLRVSEVCKLRVADIDSTSMRIFVYQGKRGKDRYTLLSQANLDILREYWLEYRPRHPDGWLFLNADGSRHFHKRVIQETFSTALWDSGIQKKASVHTLRSSFATHLLEAGVDFFTVKRLLGHADMSSTTRYLGVTEFDLSLKSPLDSMPQKRGRKPKAATETADHHA